MRTFMRDSGTRHPASPIFLARHAEDSVHAFSLKRSDEKIRAFSHCPIALAGSTAVLPATPLPGPTRKKQDENNSSSQHIW